MEEVRATPLPIKFVKYDGKDASTCAMKELAVLRWCCLKDCYEIAESIGIADFRDNLLNGKTKNEGID